MRIRQIKFDKLEVTWAEEKTDRGLISTKEQIELTLKSENFTLELEELFLDRKAIFFEEGKYCNTFFITEVHKEYKTVRLVLQGVK